MGTRVKLILQPKQDGLGHAILTAESFVGDESFVVLLGDHLYGPPEEKSDRGNCIVQLMTSYSLYVFIIVLDMQFWCPSVLCLSMYLLVFCSLIQPLHFSCESHFFNSLPISMILLHLYFCSLY